MLASVLRKITRSGSKNAKKRVQRRGLRMEQLETRAMLSTTHFVDDDLADCPKAEFTSIQAAVTAASPGDRIRVCEGVYREQVTIPETKDDIELRSKKPLAAVIEAPPGMTEPAIVHVDGADDVTIRGFTIRGPFVPLPPLATGVFVGGGGSATIVGNHITAIRAEPLNGVQNGIGILVGRGSTGEVGTANILRNRIDDYQKGGIVVDGEGSSALVSKNEVVGAGPTDEIAQNGIQVSRGADALVTRNYVAGNVYTGPAEADAACILLFEPGETDITQKVVTEKEDGIYAYDAERIAITRNKVTDNTNKGIVLDLVNHSSVAQNDVSDNRYGIELVEANNNLVRHNRTNGNDLDGIRLRQSNDNRIEQNQSFRNGRDGIRVVTQSSGNLIRKNVMLRNDEHDAHDSTVGTGTAGTANIWAQNVCETENREGLCDHRGKGRGRGDD